MLRLIASSIALAQRQLREAEDGLRGGSVSLGRLRLIADTWRALARLEGLGRVMEVIAMGRRSSADFNKEDTMGELIDHPAMFAGKSREGAEELFWPTLNELKMGDGEIRHRLAGIGGSDANIILSGDRDKVLALWREKRSEQPAPDLTANLAVMLGSWTETFNRQWFEKVSGRHVEQVGAKLACSANAWRRCSLDGYLSDTSAVWEAKHTNAFAKAEDVLERYMPQLQHNMAVARSDQAVLSVIFGNHKYEIIEVASDWIYQIELLQAEVDFWDCVQTGREPVPAVPPAPPRPVGVREVCLAGNNAWAAAAADWLEHREGAKIHAGACTLIKDLVEPDVARAFGHGIEAKRSKAGAISIREVAQ